MESRQTPTHPNSQPSAVPLAGRVAVVTGGGRGVGRAISLTLARLGARVIVGYHQSAEAAEATAREAAALHAQALAAMRDRAVPDAPGATPTPATPTTPAIVTFQANVAVAAEVEALVARAVALGGPHIWVNNAGASANSSESQGMSDEERWDRSMQVDLKGTWLGCRLAAPAIRAAGGGAIVNIGWAHALDGAPGLPGLASQLYAASKAGVLALTRVFAQEWAPDVRVNAVAPGWVENDWSATRPAAFHDRIAAGVPLRRWGAPQDIADAVAYLASPAASYVTGQTLVVDGGAVMR